jgi:hypothetical protein
MFRVDTWFKPAHAVLGTLGAHMEAALRAPQKDFDTEIEPVKRL